MANQNNTWADIIITALKTLGFYYVLQGLKEKNKKNKK